MLMHFSTTIHGHISHFASWLMPIVDPRLFVSIGALGLSEMLSHMGLLNMGLSQMGL